MQQAAFIMFSKLALIQANDYVALVFVGYMILSKCKRSTLNVSEREGECGIVSM
jgi:hypothetical protein